MADGDRNRMALERHWASAVAGDLDTEQDVYHEDVVVDYPQSGERIRGRENLRAVRTHHPSRMEYAVHRITGQGDVWVTESVSEYERSDRMQREPTVEDMRRRGRIEHIQDRRSRNAIPRQRVDNVNHVPTSGPLLQCLAKRCFVAGA